jgi:hypothetical protein
MGILITNFTSPGEVLYCESFNFRATIGESLKELGQNNTGIAAGSVKCSICDGHGCTPGVHLDPVMSVIEDRFQGKAEVGAGITVGNRKHVYPIKILLTSHDTTYACRECPVQPETIQISDFPSCHLICR